MIGPLGLGAVSPFGVGVEPLLAALDGAVAPFEPDDRWGSDPVTTRRGVVPGFRPRRLLPDRKAIKVMSRDAQLAVVAALEACGPDPAARWGVAPERFGAFGAAGYEAAELDDVRDMMVAARDPADPRRLSVERLYGPGRDAYHPLAPLKTLPNMALFHVGVTLGLRGPQLALGSSPAAGLAALGEAVDAVRYGDADAALAVATDSMLSLSRLEAMVEAGLLPGATWPAEGAAAVVIGADADVGVLAWAAGQAPVTDDAPERSYGAVNEAFEAALVERLAAGAGIEEADVLDVVVGPSLGYVGAAEGLLAVILAVEAVRRGRTPAARVLARGLAGDVTAVLVGRS